MDDIADEQLLEKYVKSGELRYFDALTRRYVGKVRAMIYPMVLNDADADELTQDVFQQVVGNIHRFKGRSAFSTWLYRIAMNIAHNFLKRRTRNPVEHRENPPDSPGGKSWSPTETIMGMESDARVTKALESLSPPLRAAIALTAIQGFSIKEAAQVDHCLMATMYWRVHHARKLLRKMLSEEDGIHEI
ncbi:MAG: RNA polymerase sigma factor [bacterium]